jgi:pyridoxal phosphate enzyme (YggS family)
MPSKGEPAALIPSLKRNLDQVEERLAAACRRAGRQRNDVTLVAVTKTVSAEVAGQLPKVGVQHLGESRPQALWHKAATLPPTVQWHLIGHLQRNKVEKTLALAHLIHSVDSLRLLRALEEAAARQKRPVAVLLEVNASREPGKHGFAPEEVLGLPPHLQVLEHVQVRGLMTMAAFEVDPEQCRSVFRTVRQLCERLRADLPPPHSLDQLSMGMSNDFEVAVEEGATLVRLGTVLFEGVPGNLP